MDFVTAMRLAAQGKPVKRTGWSEGVSIGSETKGELLIRHQPVPYFEVVPYSPTINDILADDWQATK